MSFPQIYLRVQCNFNSRRVFKNFFFFLLQHQANSKIYMEMQRAQSSQNNFGGKKKKKENIVGGLIPADFQVYYEIKTVWHWYKVIQY